MIFLLCIYRKVPTTYVNSVCGKERSGGNGAYRIDEKRKYKGSFGRLKNIVGKINIYYNYN